MINMIKPSNSSYGESILQKTSRLNAVGMERLEEIPLPKNTEASDTKNVSSTDKKICKTCERRRYQDGSDDPGVSFKSPGYISPEMSAAVVISHEEEHVTNERAKAKSEEREVLSQNVQIYTAVCPECGRTYVSGGKTTTVTRSKNNSVDAKDPTRGEKFDQKV